MVSFILFIILLILQILLFFDALKKLTVDIECIIDCLLHKDYSISISQQKKTQGVYNKLALLIEKSKENNTIQSSQNIIFHKIIEHLPNGMLILRKNRTGNIEIFVINQAFCDFLKIPKLYQWNILLSKIPELIKIINPKKWGSLKHVITLKINNTSETFYLKTSVIQNSDFQYQIISLETVQQLIDKKEKESWYKLMNVMSHEIINTITPISSLADNLEGIVLDELTAENVDELSQGLRIIKKRSQHLTRFVNTYRKLAALPLPQKKMTNIAELIENTVALFQQQFDKHTINVKKNMETPYWLQIDPEQIEQVFINLILNSIHALQTTEAPYISIEISQNDSKINIFFSDNGSGISDTIKDSVFIPYFTTRKDGAGIGLTLSKAIMEAHQGHMYFTSDTVKTTFVLSFNYL